MNTNNTPVLQTHALSKHFGGIHALDRVDLSVMRGEIHAVIGPNGAGKTTFIAQLAGELKPDAGKIYFQGRDITALNHARRAWLGLARSFQITSVIMPMTLLENVMLAVHATRARSSLFGSAFSDDHALRDAAMQTLARVGLDDNAGTLVAEVSHGQHRQLEIAMALAMQPKLLLLDEPTSGMSAHESANMVALLADLKRKTTMLLIEHDMEAVFALADTISVLVGGRVLASGTPAKIRDNVEVQRAYLGEVV